MPSRIQDSGFQKTTTSLGVTFLASVRGTFSPEAFIKCGDWHSQEVAPSIQPSRRSGVQVPPSSYQMTEDQSGEDLKPTKLRHRGRSHRLK
jgi:hypothetical protein